MFFLKRCYGDFVDDETASRNVSTKKLTILKTWLSPIADLIGKQFPRKVESKSRKRQQRISTKFERR
jgi:hypothetical protein